MRMQHCLNKLFSMIQAVCSPDIYTKLEKMAQLAMSLPVAQWWLCGRKWVSYPLRTLSHVHDNGKLQFHVLFSQIFSMMFKFEVIASTCKVLKQVCASFCSSLQGFELSRVI